MKAFIVSMMVVAGATVANAASFVESNGAQEVEYITWCQGNTVVGLTEKGDVYAVANCDEQALVCKTTKKPLVGKTVVSASCKAQ